MGIVCVPVVILTPCDVVEYPVAGIDAYGTLEERHCLRRAIRDAVRRCRQRAGAQLYS